MKRIVVILLGLGLLFTSCQQKELQPTSGDGENETVNITVYAADPISVRSGDDSSTNSASGGITNVSGLSLRYILAVYDKDATDGSTPVEGPQTAVAAVGDAASFSLKLSSKQTYKFVVWADFVEDEDGEDYHYDTTGFPEITYNDLDEDGDPDFAINDESYDAFYACETKTVSGSNLTLTLGRPFAKLRLVTTDWDDEKAPDQITVTYDSGRYTTFNVLDGDVVESDTSETLSFTADLDDTNPYSGGVDATEGTRTIAVDYLFAKAEKTTVHISYTAEKDGEEFNSLVIGKDIPLQRNYLTTVSGALLSSDDSFAFGITIGDDFVPTTPEYVGYFGINSDKTIKYNGKTYYTLEIGEDYALKLTPKFNDVEDSALTNANWTWSSDDTDVATVVAGTETEDLGKGIVTGVATGFVTITAAWYDETNDINYSCSGYLCVIDPSLGGVKVENNTVTVSIDDTQLTGYWEEPFGTEQTLTWAMADGAESGIITLANDGTIAATNFGTTTIKVTSSVTDDTHIADGYSSELTLTVNVVKGYYNDTFTDENNCNWALNKSYSATSTWNTSDLGENYLKVDVDLTAGSGRGDIGHLTTTSSTNYGSNGSHDVYLDPTNYPIVCFRIDDVNDSGFGRNITIDTSGHDEDNTTYSGGLGGNNQTWSKKYSCTDGSAIIYYDLSSKGFATGGILEKMGTFTTFAIKYADITAPNSETSVSYRFFWFKTFASVSDLEAYMSEWSAETGITY